MFGCVWSLPKTASFLIIQSAAAASEPMLHKMPEDQFLLFHWLVNVNQILWLHPDMESYIGVHDPEHTGQALLVVYVLGGFHSRLDSLMCSGPVFIALAVYSIYVAVVIYAPGVSFVYMYVDIL